MFVIAVVVILILSVGLALLSLKKEFNRAEHKKAEEVQQSLSKGRVIFYAPGKDHSSSS